MLVTACGYLGLVRNADDLAFLTQFTQQPAYHFCCAAADTDVDFVEYQRRYRAGLRGDNLDRKTQDWLR